MQINKVQIYQHTLPVKDGPYTMAGQEVWTLDSTIVRLTGDNGVTGWGEVCPLGTRYAPVTAKTVRAALTDIAPALIGVEAAPIPVQRAIDGVVTGQTYARAAIDIAVHDLLGKTLGVPVLREREADSLFSDALQTLAARQSGARRKTPQRPLGAFGNKGEDAAFIADNAA